MKKVLFGVLICVLSISSTAAFSCFAADNGFTVNENIQEEALLENNPEVKIDFREVDGGKMEVKVKAIYKHFKGDYYLVEDIATHSETGEKLVVYRTLYGDLKLFVRPYEMFLEKVDKIKYPEVKQEYRFELQKIKSIREK